jgi:hypothetical protein
MPDAVRFVVETYVRSSNRRALEDLRSSREDLIVSFRTLGGGYDLSKIILAQLENDIAIIEEGISKLSSAPVAHPGERAESASRAFLGALQRLASSSAGLQ